MESFFDLEASRIRAFAWLIVPMAVISFIALFVAVPLVERSRANPMPVYLSVLGVSLFALLLFSILQGRLYLKRKVTIKKTPQGLEILLGQKVFRKFGIGYSASFCMGLEKVNRYTRKMAKRIVIRQYNRSTFISEVIDTPVKAGMCNLEVSDLVARVPGTIDELMKYLELKS